MRKVLTAAAVGAGAIAALGAASPVMAAASGVMAGPVSLVNVDASDAAHWQICGQNILTTSVDQNCDNRDHFGDDQGSGVQAGDVSAVNVDASDAAHWQICGQNVLTQSFGQVCDNRDHFGDNAGSGIQAGDVTLANADASSAAHWQICGQNVGVSPSLDQQCLNADHVSDNGDHPGKGADQGDY
ncbi:hypothetical protein [Glycomyces artemisiae]|uniref:Ricin-type beta-trefoil lectin protein n=1 Tax=Glycomyces artemisiae TaxID=1076443 RepID=A0A2T0UM95_9ACTN|nr:hypothetical protein [Glycomyces artemisiae]PRY59052.1 hypothetical protein B0I28_104208 [Glycomyces artemisiae]